LTTLITRATPQEEQGAVLGLTQSLTSVAMILAPLASGYLIEHGLLTTWGLTAAGISAIALVLAAKSPRQ
jgi:MFS family permease